MRFTTESGQVTAFMAQYETLIEGEPVPVVRFDTAHGFPHRDILDRRGRIVTKSRLEDQLTLGAALTHAEHDIQYSWPQYREAFFKDQQ